MSYLPSSDARGPPEGTEKGAAFPSGEAHGAGSVLRGGVCVHLGHSCPGDPQCLDDSLGGGRGEEAAGHAQAESRRGRMLHLAEQEERLPLCRREGEAEPLREAVAGGLRPAPPLLQRRTVDIDLSEPSDVARTDIPFGDPHQRCRVWLSRVHLHRVSVVVIGSVPRSLVGLGLHAGDEPRARCGLPSLCRAAPLPHTFGAYGSAGNHAATHPRFASGSSTVSASVRVYPQVQGPCRNLCGTASDTRCTGLARTFPWRERRPPPVVRPDETNRGALRDRTTP